MICFEQLFPKRWLKMGIYHRYNRKKNHLQQLQGKQTVHCCTHLMFWLHYLEDRPIVPGRQGYVVDGSPPHLAMNFAHEWKGSVPQPQRYMGDEHDHHGSSLNYLNYGNWDDPPSYGTLWKGEVIGLWSHNRWTLLSSTATLEFLKKNATKNFFTKRNPIQTTQQKTRTHMSFPKANQYFEGLTA